MEHETPDLVLATRYAAACAMHTGKRFVVHRANVGEGRESDTPLFSINPTTFDYRSVVPETALAMKAMAHELVSNIDTIVPEFPNEGPAR